MARRVDPYTQIVMMSYRMKELEAERDAAVKELADFREQHSELLEAGRAWVKADMSYCTCGDCGDCEACTLAAGIASLPDIQPATKQDKTP